MQGNILGQTGVGLKINGIIEEYKVASGGNVRAGDFVQYINKTITTKSNTKLNSEKNTGRYMRATLLNENRVFIASIYGTNYYLYGMVCEIEDNTITIKSEKVLSTSKLDYTHKPYLVSLSENKVIIFYKLSMTTSLYGIVCNIGDNAITTSTSTQISSGSIYKILKLKENRIILIYYKENYINGMVCEVENNIITVIKDETICYAPGVSHYRSAILIKENTIFINYSSNSSSTTSPNILYGIVCKIEEDMRFTIGVSTQLRSSTADKGGNLSATKLDENKVFIAFNTYNSSNSSWDIYTGSYEIKNTLITEYTPILNTYKGSCSETLFPFAISAVTLSKNRVFVIYCNGGTYSHYSLYGLEFIIINRKIRRIIDKVLDIGSYTGYSILGLHLQNNKIFIAHTYSDSNYDLNGKVIDIDSGILNIVSLENEMFGLAKTKGIEGQTVKVYVPKLPEYILTEDENRMITENGEEIRNE